MVGGGLEQRGRSRTEGTPHPGSLQVMRAKPGVPELRGDRGFSLERVTWFCVLARFL